MAAAGGLVHHLHGERGLHAVLHRVPGRLHRRIPLEPRRKLARLFGVAVHHRHDLTAGRRAGGSPRAGAAGADRRRRSRARPVCQLLRRCALATRHPLRRADDAGGELPRPRRVRAAALAPVRAQPRHGGGDRAVGEWVCPRVLGALGAGADHGARLGRAGFMAAAALPLAALFRGAEFARPAATQAAATASWTLKRAIRTPHFWLLFLVYVFTGLGSFLVALHQLAFAVTVGFDKLYAAWVLGLGAFLSLPGVIVTGWLSDRIGRELAGVITYATSIFGVVCALFITSPDQHLLLWLHACFFGLTWGARGPSITAKTADLFPGPQLGTILGAITMGTGVGSALGSWLAGFTFDATGSYRVAFTLSIIFYACGSGG